MVLQSVLYKQKSGESVILLPLLVNVQYKPLSKDSKNPVLMTQKQSHFCIYTKKPELKDFPICSTHTSDKAPRCPSAGE